MLSFTNTTQSDPFSGTFLQGPAVMSRPVGAILPDEFFYVWNATGRPAENSSGQRGSKVDVSLRTSESIFAVGLKEVVTLETNNAASWRWRRICFTSKDDFGESDPDTSNYFRRTSSGMVRLVRAENDPTYLQDQLFEGQRNRDWLSMMTAPVSTRHFSIKYDKTRIIKSQNDAGLTHTYRLWHPMRHNIMYDGEQSGETLIDSAVSATGNRGMGNYYVVDIFTKHGNNDNVSTLTFAPEASFYWHEK